MAIPTINLAPYLSHSSSPESKAKLIEDVKSACETYGFLQITGHGIPLSSQKSVLESAKKIFALPLEEKEALSLKNSPSRHGYERMKEQVLDKKALPDDKEGFYIGRDEPHHIGFRQGPNQWPPSLPPLDFQEPVMEYYAHLLSLAGKICEILVLGLGHPLSSLEKFTEDANMNLKLLHYPPHTSKDARQFGAAEHTDFGVITILLQQPGKNGLQVFDAPSERWLDIPAQEDVLVVNLGDLTQKWTNGKYRSTVHRVINRSGDERYSVPCFYEGNLQATNPFDPEGREGETVEVHLRRRFDSTYGL